jgi:hypothetical protein
MFIAQCGTHAFAISCTFRMASLRCDRSTRGFGSAYSGRGRESQRSSPVICVQKKDIVRFGTAYTMSSNASLAAWMGLF